MHQAPLQQQCHAPPTGPGPDYAPAAPPPPPPPPELAEHANLIYNGSFELGGYFWAPRLATAPPEVHQWEDLPIIHQGVGDGEATGIRGALATGLGRSQAGEASLPAGGGAYIHTARDVLVLAREGWHLRRVDPWTVELVHVPEQDTGS